MVCFTYFYLLYCIVLYIILYCILFYIVCILYVVEPWLVTLGM